MPTADAKRFQDVLKSALWRDNVLRLKAQAQVRLSTVGSMLMMSRIVAPLAAPPMCGHAWVVGLLFLRGPAAVYLYSLRPVHPHAHLQEYNGETRQRYALQDIRPTDYAAECRRLLACISTAA